MDNTQRVFLYGRKVAHLVGDNESLNGSYPPALCGLQPQWSQPWLGTGSQAEYEAKEQLRLCRKCKAAVSS